jgi:hypothetical protein
VSAKAARSAQRLARLARFQSLHVQAAEDACREQSESLRKASIAQATATQRLESASVQLADLQRADRLINLRTLELAGAEWLNLVDQTGQLNAAAQQEQEKLDAALIVRQQERHKENILLRVIDERLKLHARELTIQLEHEISDIWMAGHYEYFDSEPRRS